VSGSPMVALTSVFESNTKIKTVNKIATNTRAFCEEISNFE